MEQREEWFVRTEEGKVYGPADKAALAEWSRDGRIEPSCFVSSDRVNWHPAQLMPELEMKWLVETMPGKFFGPFHRKVVSRLFAAGQVPEGAKAYRLHELAIDDDPPPVEKVVEKEVRVEVPVEKIVEKEVRVEVPVEKIVEKEVRVEVPVEKVVEKEVRVEVPVEKIVEKVVEKVVEKEVRVEVPVEKIVEREVRVEVPVEKIVEVLPPGRDEIVVPEVVEPVGKVPPQRGPGALFGGLDRAHMAALEAAAQRELSRGRSFGFPKKLFGRKHG